MDHTQLNRYIDSAVLQPGLARADAIAAMQSGIEFEVKAICVRPADLQLAVDLCRGTRTAAGTVLSFPHGVGLPAVKTAEARHYIALGASEIDMVVNYGLIRSDEWQLVREDMRAVSQVTRDEGIILKAILETSELDEAQIRRATELAIEAQVDFVKSSTGFASGGATREAVAAMLAAADGAIAVKASGGIRDSAAAWDFIHMGCTRLGVGSTTVAALLAGEHGARAEAY